MRTSAPQNPLLQPLFRQETLTPHPQSVQEAELLRARPADYAPRVIRFTEEGKKEVVPSARPRNGAPAFTRRQLRDLREASGMRKPGKVLAAWRRHLVQTLLLNRALGTRPARPEGA